jgi:RNA recognition motif-containing protein
MTSRFIKEKAIKNLEAIIKNMHPDNTDILLMKEYHKLYKKNVSFFKRSWAAAWLFMYYDQKENITWQSAEKPNTINKNEEKPSTLVELTEDESKKLFISIGKNRRLFPREIITLIMSKTSSEREDIGMIKILDNYSFVQVKDSRAEEIINALNGLRFRGRTLSVNFAKPKNMENDT